MKNSKLKVGKKAIVIDDWVVKDEGAKTNKGKIIKLHSEKVYGYKNERNYYVDMKMDDGSVHTFNQYEVKLDV